MSKNINRRYDKKAEFYLILGPVEREVNKTLTDGESEYMELYNYGG